jgi:hypothetical protein
MVRNDRRNCTDGQASTGFQKSDQLTELKLQRTAQFQEQVRNRVP